MTTLECDANVTRGNTREGAGKIAENAARAAGQTSHVVHNRPRLPKPSAYSVAHAMETPQQERNVHDIYPDAEQHPGHSPTDPASDRGPSINGAVNYARPRPVHLPPTSSPDYHEFKKRDGHVFRVTRHELDREIRKMTGVACIWVDEHVLTVHHCFSQSKLSQQELVDLQKATHFDKKELQQWYKGMPGPTRAIQHAPAAG